MSCRGYQRSGRFSVPTGGMSSYPPLSFGTPHLCEALRGWRRPAMDGPISPPPVVGSAGNELPAYMSNGVVGLKVRDNPLTPGMALLSGFSGEHPERKIEAAAFAPYPVAGDICLGGVWMSDAPQCVRVIDQAYDFSTAELTTRLTFKVGSCL